MFFCLKCYNMKFQTEILLDEKYMKLISHFELIAQ